MLVADVREGSPTEGIQTRGRYRREHPGAVAGRSSQTSSLERAPPDGGYSVRRGGTSVSRSGDFNERGHRGVAIEGQRIRSVHHARVRSQR